MQDIWLPVDVTGHFEGSQAEKGKFLTIGCRIRGVDCTGSLERVATDEVDRHPFERHLKNSRLDTPATPVNGEFRHRSQRGRFSADRLVQGQHQADVENHTARGLIW